ncbi:3,4-dihydroxy-2-butanone-4-phosphate synthase [Pendulispora albinea]|uniref:3,4-dihydroxy-2-butanone 4-phosphate synthase n=1 Tax=Pendulispora albinea TaxID=2741071 RepID=A0ABZ2LY32_9BACT
MNPATIVELVRARTEENPRRLAFRFLTKGTGGAETLDYGELHQRARAIATTLREAGLAGQRAILLYPPGLEYIHAFFGCLYAEVTAVPCYPPGLTRASAAVIPRIAEDAGAKAVLTLSSWSTDEARGAWFGRALQTLHDIVTIATDRIEHHAAHRWRAPALTDRSLAFLQYTSGSTGDPKGVMVTHGALMANLRMIAHAFRAGERDRAVFWLPPYHDMGLVGSILGSLSMCMPATLMPPATFMRAPLAWLEAISDVRATVTGAPNFAFDRCVRAALARPELARHLDLSSLELTFNGAEMVRSDTMNAFCEVFAKNGFRRESLFPCYGMAETTLLCASRPRMGGVEVLRIDRKRLEQDGRAIAVREPRAAVAPDAPERGWTLVGAGQAAIGTDVRIVNETTHEPCEPGEVGEVWIHGPSVAAGYWGKPELSERTFRARLAGSDDTSPRFLRTGDRGFLCGNELYLVGRSKDTVIANGRNYAAEDLESSMRMAHPAIKPHRCVAIAIEEASTERLVLLVECDNKILAETNARAEQVLEAIHRRIRSDHGLDAHVVLAVKSGDLPVTTSGKSKRSACRTRYAERTLQIVARRGEDLDAYVSAVQKAASRLSGLSPDPRTRLGDLGLDSLGACNLSAELADRFGVDLGPAHFVAEATIERIAAQLEEHARASRVQEPQESHKSHEPHEPQGQGPPKKSEPLATRLRGHAEHFGRLESADVLNYNLVQERKLNATDARLGDETLTFFSSYSYLGLGDHPQVLQAKVEAIQRFGSGSHGVALLGGYTSEHEALERTLAASFHTDEALLYSSGYMANLAAIDGLMKEDGIIYCDRLVHTSILDGCRLSGAEVRMFPHQNEAALARMLARRPRGRPALVIVDGVYSLRGEIANLPALVDVAHRHGALIMVDEAHALGGIGHRGRGTAEHHGLEGHVDLFTGGLGKGIPAHGGFVAGRSAIVHYLRFRSNPHVFSGAMDPANVAAARAALRVMESDPAVMGRLRDNIALMERLLEAHRIPSLRWGSPCMPVVCDDDTEAHALSREMRRRGFYIAPIVYPAVPKEQQGLRLTVTAAHTTLQISRCVKELDDALCSLRNGVASRTRPHVTCAPTPYTLIPEALAAFARGEPVLVSDDEDRENEGDLVIAAEHATAAAINFMITHGKGLVCLAISHEIATQKQLQPMVTMNRDPKGTAFTISIDADPKYGITTGISASERARTVGILIDAAYGPEALRSPGHMFPLVAREGGLKVRRGHTEAGVDMARLAGCTKAAAVLVEVINEAGEMARRDELIEMAKQFHIPYITIEQLTQYIAKAEKLDEERRHTTFLAHDAVEARADSLPIPKVA